MEILNIYLIGWKSFFLIVIGLCALLLLYRTILKGIIENYLSDAHGKQLDPRFIYIQRVLVITWVFVLGFSFLLISPYVHGVILLILILLTYQYLSNYVQGTFLIRELSLMKGMQFSIGANSGLIDKLSATGLFLTFSDKNYFVAYSKLLQKMGATYQKVRSSKYRLVCTSNQPEDFEKSQTKLNRKLFLSPFIIDQIKPTIQPIGGQIEITMQIKNPEFIPNIIQTIEKAGFTVVQNEK